MQSRSALRDLALATLIFALSIPGCGRKSAPAEVADTIFINGGIYTVDAKRSWAEAAAVRDGRIVAVGRNEEVLPLKGDTTRVVDLAGRMALPGFHDSHVHVAVGRARGRCSVAINDLKTVEAILDVVKDCAARTEDEWIVGGGWWVSLFDHRGPRKELLDQAVPGRAVILWRRGRAQRMGELACARARRHHRKDAGSRGRSDRARPAHRRAERHAAREPRLTWSWPRRRSPARRCGWKASGAGCST